MVFAAAARRAVQLAAQTRSFASHGPRPGDITYAGLTLHQPSIWHRAGAEILGGTMWAWLLIRLYEDGDALFVGHAAHFEHELHEMAHAHEHGEEKH